MQSVWPSETAGDGKLRRQYYKLSDGQGIGLNRRRVSCRQCGFTGCDLVQHDHSGGSLSGDGAGGSVSSGDQAYNVGAGCPLCFSKSFYGRSSRFDEFLQKAEFGDRLR